MKFFAICVATALARPAWEPKDHKFFIRRLQNTQVRITNGFADRYANSYQRKEDSKMTDMESRYDKSYNFNYEASRLYQEGLSDAQFDYEGVSDFGIGLGSATDAQPATDAKTEAATETSALDYLTGAITDLGSDGSDTVDHRGKIPGVKSQGSCGSCWAFAIGVQVGGQAALELGVPPHFISTQEQVDCCDNCGGCAGAWPSAAYRYMVDNGISGATKAPYYCDYGCNDDRLTCDESSAERYLTMSGFVYKTRPSGMSNEDFENQMLEDVRQRPVTIALMASSNFMKYGGGIFDSNDCGESVNHAVTVVGAGTENGKPYWLIQNSWGNSWGQDGYMKIIRNKNMCQMTTYGYWYAEGLAKVNEPPVPTKDQPEHWSSSCQVSDDCELKWNELLPSCKCTSGSRCYHQGEPLDGTGQGNSHDVNSGCRFSFKSLFADASLWDNNMCACSHSQEAGAEFKDDQGTQASLTARLGLSDGSSSAAPLAVGAAALLTLAI